ncbi:class I SAM-dependent methyltransferase [bacterium]|jgi:SAM-dependent methyltransferase|nr:class I SAM-dependent methyltransferase [bacterium]
MQPIARDEFRKRGPWVTRFDIEGETLGGQYHAATDQRLKQFFDRFPHPARVLELGCLEGGHSVEIARAADHVTAIDSRVDNIERARFIASFFGRSNVDFILADLERFPLTSLGTFDVIFNVGLLYHLPEPWRLVDELAKIGKSMFLWTHTADPSATIVEREGFMGQVYKEGGTRDPLSGMSATSFWPTPDSLERMLALAGFKYIDIVDVDATHPHGPAVTLVCHQNPPARRSSL